MLGRTKLGTSRDTPPFPKLSWFNRLSRDPGYTKRTRIKQVVSYVLCLWRVKEAVADNGGVINLTDLLGGEGPPGEEVGAARGPPQPGTMLLVVVILITMCLFVCYLAVGY